MQPDWQSILALANDWSQLDDRQREDALNLTQGWKPALDELPRIFELAERVLPPKPTVSGAAAGSPTETAETAAGQGAGRRLVDGLLLQLASALDWRREVDRPRLSVAEMGRLDRLYRALGPASRGRFALLQLLAAAGQSDSLALFAELMATDPPRDARQAGYAFLPLFCGHDFPAEALFPRLLDGLAQPSTATLTLDTANYAVRHDLLSEHPAAARSGDLAGLLAGVVQRLLQVEEQPPQSPAAAEQTREAVADWVALSIALCDALSLIGDPSVGGKLEQALSVGHRRLRTEAAAALARLGEQRGLEVLAQLSAEPGARLRAIAYLEELGQLERVEPQHRTPEARAAGELAAWLAQPSQFGLPPASIELVDHCRQFWPGYGQPVDCYLLSFEYSFVQGEYSNVGIVGPATQALTADLEELPPADVYAIFAGWQAEHPEIVEQQAVGLPLPQRQAADQRLARLAEQGFSDLALVKLGSFFGDLVLVASARRETILGTVIVDGQAVEWYPQTGPRSIGPQEAYWMHKGRKLLKAFNPAAGEEA